MRKLILIAVFATMSSSVCHANLSLASNEPAQLPQAALEAKAEVTAEAPVTTAKPVKVSRPRHQSVRTFAFPRYGHCL
jgi:hypothetical protein